jgi:transcriptional accessory protein Tex/SPT6
VRLAWRTRILVHIESDLRLRLWQAAEDASVQVFAGNLRDLLLAAPAGARPTMGLDPGYRTGVKVAVVTGTGQQTPRWREMDSNPQSLERGTTLFKIAPFDHSYNSVLVTEIISARPEVGPIWGVRRRGK